MHSFVELLRHQFACNASRPAVIYHDEIITFGQLEAQAKRVGAFLQEKGLQKGDRVVLYTPEKFSFLVIHLGILLSGGVSVPLNHDFTKDEMLYFFNDSGARFAFTSHRDAPLLREIQGAYLLLEEVFEHGKSEVIENSSNKFTEAEVEKNDPCFILYSSGTTGRPKGVVHTHRNVAASLLALQACWKFTQEDVLLNVLPLYHLHGLSFAAHVSLISGSTMMLEDTFLHAMDKIKDATVFMAVPSIYYAFLRRRREFEEAARKWHRVRLFTCGSAPIRSDALLELEAILSKHVINRYGMTESHVITSLPLDGSYKHGAVGLPIGGIEMKLSEKNNEGVGEVIVRSKNLFKEYWSKPEATKAAFDVDGFFHTGDLGYIDEGGFLTLLGRKDDLIIVDGENVYPSVIERVLDECEQVRESAVIGIPDDQRGERIIAFVVPMGDFDTSMLQRHCAERLAPYQCPARFEYIKELPRNTMSKVLKRELRNIFV